MMKPGVLMAAVFLALNGAGLIAWPLGWLLSPLWIALALNLVTIVVKGFWS